jgi:hypothetical protein
VALNPTLADGAGREPAEHQEMNAPTYRRHVIGDL